jgi:2-polyprenyl-3-methyl-5-hydroxy-6-metoxy-1,4-benzoquinol methylase
LDTAYRKQYRDLYQRHWWWRAREEIISDELRKRLSVNLPVAVLDVGCGDGLFFDRLREFGEVDGIEPAEDLVDPNGPHRARITVAPFDTNFQAHRQYGLILMLDVVEHIDAPAEALRRAVSLLQPDGILVVTVPAFQVIWTNHDDLNQHRARLTKRSFGQLAASAGMEILEARYIFHWLFLAKVGVRMAQAILPRKPLVPRIPPTVVNKLLHFASRTEERLTRNLSIPFGSSLLVVGRRARKVS